MEYTDEEKKAIEQIKDELEYYTKKHGNLDKNNKEYDDVILYDIRLSLKNGVSILNLLERQQKEIYDLKNQTQIISPLYVKENYISKDTIKEKIKELEKLILKNDKLIVECRRTIMENQPEKKIKIAKARMDNVTYHEMISYLKELLGGQHEL